MAYDDDAFYGFRPYVSVGSRRAFAALELARLKKAGRTFAPVAIEGRKIARTFWGEAWCGNLERYSDFANRLPRGRTYVRNGSVVDLQLHPGQVTALVSGSTLYEVNVTVGPVPRARWNAICQDCSGAIDSLIELLQGRLSTGVMTRLCDEKTGLFPSPKDIHFTCSCPDWASMCKHVAAVLYGIGARLDHQPELLFTLRKINQEELVANAGTRLSKTRPLPASARVLAADDLSEMFGIDMAPPATAERTRPAKSKKPAGKGERHRLTSKQRQRIAERMRTNFLSQLTEGEQARLLEELNYMNLEEIRGFCSARGIPYKIMAEYPNGKVKTTKDTDRKPVVLARVRRYLTTGEVGPPTLIPVNIVREENPPAQLGRRDRLYYRWYAKEHQGVMRLLRDLTDGRFQDGAVARVVVMGFWTRGEAPTVEKFARSWTKAKAEEHRLLTPEYAYLTDLKHRRADGGWKALRTAKAKSALRTLARIAPTRRAAEGWLLSR